MIPMNNTLQLCLPFTFLVQSVFFQCSQCSQRKVSSHLAVVDATVVFIFVFMTGALCAQILEVVMSCKL